MKGIIELSKDEKIETLEKAKIYIHNFKSGMCSAITKSNRNIGETVSNYKTYLPISRFIPEFSLLRPKRIEYPFECFWYKIIDRKSRIRYLNKVIKYIKEN